MSHCGGRWTYVVRKNEAVEGFRRSLVVLDREGAVDRVPFSLSFSPRLLFFTFMGRRQFPLSDDATLTRALVYPLLLAIARRIATGRLIIYTHRHTDARTIMDVESAARDIHALPGLVVLISVPLVVTILSLARLSSSLVLGSGSGPVRQRRGYSIGA